MKPRPLLTACLGELNPDITPAEARMAYAELSAGDDLPEIEALSRIRRILALYREPYVLPLRARRINFPLRRRKPSMPPPPPGTKAARLVGILERGAMLDEIAILLDWAPTTTRKRVMEIGRRWRVSLIENRYGQIKLRW